MTQDILLSWLELKGKNSTRFYLRRGDMKLNEANSLPVVAISGFLILGAIAFLVFWALQTAYV